MSDDNRLVQEQPRPTPNEHPACWDLVIEDVQAMCVEGKAQVATVKDMQDRDRVGLERYGTRLQPYNGRDSLVDAYQEALDLCVYLRVVLYELHEAGDGAEEELQEVYDSSLMNAVAIRSFIHMRDGK